ncbi:MAG: VOC family protein [Steroidobacteraceae bacterium]
MIVRKLDHVNIAATDAEKTLGFYASVLGLKARPFPGRSTLDGGGWLQSANGDAVVHVADRNKASAPMLRGPLFDSGSSGAVHHVAFECADYEAALARIKATGLEFVENRVEAAGLRQIFIVDPDRILLELNFRD